MRKIAIIPTLFTLGNAVCGFASIACAKAGFADRKTATAVPKVAMGANNLDMRRIGRLLVGVGFAVWSYESRQRLSPAMRSLAVLPFESLSSDSNQDYFAEGMTDELTTDLATISQLRVISRGSTMQFKGEHRPPTPANAPPISVCA